MRRANRILQEAQNQEECRGENRRPPADRFCLMHSIYWCIRRVFCARRSVYEFAPFPVFHLDYHPVPRDSEVPIQRVQHLCLNVIALRHDRHPPPHLLAPGQRQRLLAAAQQELIRLEVKLALNVISKILCFVPRICLKLILPVAGRRHDRRQALDALGMFDGDNLRDHAAHRRADDMGLAERRLPKSPITSRARLEARLGPGMSRKSK